MYTTEVLFDGPGLFFGRNRNLIIRKRDPAPPSFPAGSRVWLISGQFFTLAELGTRAAYYAQVRPLSGPITPSTLIVDGDVGTMQSGHWLQVGAPLALADGGLPGETIKSMTDLALNERGDLMVLVVTETATTECRVILKNGRVLHRSGEQHDFAGQPVAIDSPLGIGYANMNADGDVAYIARFENGRDALLLNDSVVLPDQAPLDWDRDGIPEPDSLLQSFRHFADFVIGDRLNGSVALILEVDVQVAGEARSAIVSVRVPVAPELEGFCNGDGIPGCAACPCGNHAPLGSIGGCLNSDTESARLEGSGSPSLTNDALQFRVRSSSASSFASLLSADRQLPNAGVCPAGSGILSPVLDGYRCIGGNLIRHGTRATNAEGSVGFTNHGWGLPSGSATGLVTQTGAGIGQTRHFQAFYRQRMSAGCGTGQNTSNAVSVTIVP